MSDRPLSRTEKELLAILRHAHYTLDTRGVPRTAITLEPNQ